MVYINSSNLSNDFYLNYISNEWTNGSLSDKYHGVYVSKGSFVNLSNNWWGNILFYIILIILILEILMWIQQLNLMFMLVHIM